MINEIYKKLTEKFDLEKDFSTPSIKGLEGVKGEIIADTKVKKKANKKRK